MELEVQLAARRVRIEPVHRAVGVASDRMGFSDEEGGVERKRIVPRRERVDAAQDLAGSGDPSLTSLDRRGAGHVVAALHFRREADSCREAGRCSRCAASMAEQGSRVRLAEIPRAVAGRDTKRMLGRPS